MIKKIILTTLICLTVLAIPTFAQANTAKLHIEFDQSASNSFEIGSSSATEVLIGPPEFAGGQYVVDYLSSSKDQGEIFSGGKSINERVVQ